MQLFLSLLKSVVHCALFVVVVLFVSQCGVDGSSTPGGNDIGIEIAEGDIAVDPVYVRTGINSSTVIVGDLKATTYVGRNFFKEVSADEDDSVLSFNPSVNFLAMEEEFDE